MMRVLSVLLFIYYQEKMWRKIVGRTIEFKMDISVLQS